MNDFWDVKNGIGCGNMDENISITILDYMFLLLQLWGTIVGTQEWEEEIVYVITFLYLYQRTIGISPRQSGKH